MQVRIDQVNGVLREQITGIRVVRAFVREPKETERFAAANAELTDTALRAGRLMSAMFPTVLLIINVSSVAVLWIGANYVNRGRTAGRLADRLPQLPHPDPVRRRHGDVPRVDDPACHGGVRAHRRGARHAVVGRRARAPGDRGPRARHARVPRRPLRLPGRRATPCCPTSRSASRPARPRRSSARPGRASRRSSTSCLGSFDATTGAVLVDGVDVRELDPDLLWSKVGYVPQKPFLFSGTVASQPALRPPRRHRRRAVGGARDRPGGRVRAGDARRDRQRDHPGRHERVGRPAPTALDRPGARRAAGDLRVRRLVLGARPRHRRPAAGRARTAHVRMRRC